MRIRTLLALGVGAAAGAAATYLLDPEHGRRRRAEARARAATRARDGAVDIGNDVLEQAREVVSAATVGFGEGVTPTNGQ